MCDNANVLKSSQKVPLHLGSPVKIDPIDHYLVERYHIRVSAAQVDMTEVVGITISLATLVWNCYLRCKNVSSDFYDLHVDLKSLHETLVVVDEHLPRNYDLGAVRTGIDHVITDIEKLLTKYSCLDSPNKKIWQQLKWGYEEVGELRQRLTLLIGLLGIRVFR